MKNKHTHQKWKRLRARRDDPETTKHYTEQDMKGLMGDPPVGNGAGVIRPNTKDYTLPNSIDEIGEEPQKGRINTVVVVIVILSLVFISIVAYLVSRMPPRS